jgi:membrane-associated phospholipid phosphatase
MYDVQCVLYKTSSYTMKSLLKRLHCTLFIVHCTLISFAQSPYSLKTGREAVLLGAGAATYGAAFALNTTLDPLTPAQVGQLHSTNVPAFDRTATTRYSTALARASDLALGAGVGLTGAVILTSRTPENRGAPFLKSDLFTVGVMYVETMLLTNAVKDATKNAVERTRPYAYNPATPLDEKLDKDTQRSFYSGHASNAFATAVFAAEVFRHYYPGSRAKTWVWVGSLGLASATTYLRYEAGEHFPSDLLVGAAMGSLAGWGIPKLHQRRTGTLAAQLRHLTATPWSNGLASGVSIRWNVSSRSFVEQ